MLNSSCHWKWDAHWLTLDTPTMRSTNHLNTCMSIILSAYLCSANKFVVHKIVKKLIVLLQKTRGFIQDQKKLTYQYHTSAWCEDSKGKSGYAEKQVEMVQNYWTTYSTMVNSQMIKLKMWLLTGLNELALIFSKIHCWWMFADPPSIIRNRFSISQRNKNGNGEYIVR